MRWQPKKTGVRRSALWLGKTKTIKIRFQLKRRHLKETFQACEEMVALK